MYWITFPRGSLTVIRLHFISVVSQQDIYIRGQTGDLSLTDANLPQVQCLTAATVGLRLLRRVGGCRASPVQHQEELGQSA